MLDRMTQEMVEALGTVYTVDEVLRAYAQPLDRNYPGTLAAVALVGASLVSFTIAERRYSTRYSTPAPSMIGD